MGRILGVGVRNFGVRNFWLGWGLARGHRLARGETVVLVVGCWWLLVGYVGRRFPEVVGGGIMVRMGDAPIHSAGGPISKWCAKSHHWEGVIVGG